jgi:hypothetical protein
VFDRRIETTNNQQHISLDNIPDNNVIASDRRERGNLREPVIMHSHEVQRDCFGFDPRNDH